MLPRVALACAPTPLVRAERLGRHLGVDLWVKRDDLTGSVLSGNKVRKLELLLGAALAEGADTVITCGAVTSNHARATALAARQLGLRPVLLLRGDPSGVPDGNLLLDRLAGAEIVPLDPADWPARDARMAELAERVRAGGGRPYVVAEGGSSGLGALGYARAAAEVRAQRGDAPFDAQLVAVGSGGTLAGLAVGADNGPVLGVAVCDDAPTFTRRVTGLIADAHALQPPEGAPAWSVTDRWKGPAYGVPTPEVLALVAAAARLEGLVFDPVYTGKALWALAEEAAAGRVRGRALLWHTGGVFGWFGRGGEVPA